MHCSVDNYHWTFDQNDSLKMNGEFEFDGGLELKEDREGVLSLFFSLRHGLALVDDEVEFN